MEETQKEQDPIEVLLDKGFDEYKIFHRKDCLGYDCGYGIFTGEFGKNCDGVTMKFTDGKEFLSDFCTLQYSNNPHLMWDITKEIERYIQQLSSTLSKIKDEYESLN